MRGERGGSERGEGGKGGREGSEGERGGRERGEEGKEGGRERVDPHFSVNKWLTETPLPSCLILFDTQCLEDCVIRDMITRDLLRMKQK